MWANQFHQNPPRPRVGSISTLYKPVFNHATLISKIKLELAAGTEWQIFLSFSSVSLVWVPPTRRHFQYPCPKFEFTALLYNIYNAYILKQRSMGQLQKCTFYLSKWVQITHRAPHSLPECLNFQQMSRFRYNIKYLAFRWGIRGFELGGELSETGRVGFSQGRPAFVSQILFIVLPLSFAGKSLKLEIGD